MVYDVESRKTKKLNLNDSEKEFLFCENVNINDVWFLSNGYNVLINKELLKFPFGFEKEQKIIKKMFAGKIKKENCFFIDYEIGDVERLLKNMGVDRR